MRLRRSELWSILIVALGLCAIPARVSAQGKARVVAPAAVAVIAEPTSMPAGETPLVKSDPEMTDWLTKARLAIQKKEYAEAIKILQALVDKPDAGFVPTRNNTRLFLPLRDVALQMLGEIPAEGLGRYRRLYDPKARRKLDLAIEAGDLQGIKTVADQYRFTNVGPEAAEVLGQWYFDHARFAQAARTWRGLLPQVAPSRAALLTLKTAVAYHLAGDEKQAQLLAKELRTKYPTATSTLAGREQKLVSALETYLKIPSPDAPSIGPLRNTYPGWGGLPTGQAVMPDTRAVLQPYWRHPATDDSQLRLLVKPGAGLGDATDVDLSDGSVQLRLRQGKHRITASLPPLIRPVVVGDLVIYRDDERVVAVDANTGRCDADHGWQSQSLPMERKLGKVSELHQRHAMIMASRYASNPSASFQDRGRYSLTVGGGRVYALCHFPLSSVQYVSIPGIMENDKKAPKTSSSLAALSLQGQGKLDWIVGWAAGPSAGGDAFLHECTFLSAPTYVSSTGSEEGRLYTTVLRGEAYYLLCLDAVTGRLIWKSQVAQTPVMKRASYGAPVLTWHNMPMMPPAVKDDRVFVSTNAGVTAAFDAQTGQPIWAYQYGDATGDFRFHQSGVRGAEVKYSVTPMIVNDGVVITMPADTHEVMGFSAADGTLLWRDGRNHFLTAVDANRICRAGSGGVSILNARDGKELWRSTEIDCIADPIATTNSLLLTGRGKLWRVALKDYAVSSEPLQSDGLLGNLVSIDGKLIAANALGLCAYFDYDQTYAGLTECLKTASVGDRIDLLLQRGKLSFTTRRYEEALKDYNAAEELANSLPDGENKRFLQAHLSQRRYRTFIALGNNEKDADKALAWFTEAKNIARTNQEKAHMLLRIAKLLEWAGRFPEAVSIAQSLAEKYPEEQIVDVRIGQDVNALQNFGSKDPTQPGQVWALHFIDRMIQIHSQRVYAEFDEQAKRVMEQAKRNPSPEAYLSIQKRWPLSECVDDAVFAAAEMYYTQAREFSNPAQVDETLQQCENLLRQVANRQGSSHRPSALLALTMLYTAGGQPVLARRARIELADTPAETAIAFAEIHGPLGKVLQDLDDGAIKPIVVPSKPSPEQELGDIHPPLHPIFSIDDPGSTLLFDDDGNPLRLGEILFVQQKDKALLVDTSSDSAEQSIRGEALTKVWNQPNQSFAAGMSRDGTIMAVANRQRVSVFRTDTCKLLWQADWPSLGCPRVKSVSIGDGSIAVLETDGRLMVFDMATGKMKWQYQPSASGGSARGPDIESGMLPPGAMQNRMVVVRGGRARRIQSSAGSWAASQTPKIGDGMIMAPIFTGKCNYVVFDAQNGKKLLSHTVFPGRMQTDFRGRIHEAFLGDGCLAIAVNGKFALYNLKKSNKPVLEKMIHLHKDVNVNLLGWDRNFLALRGQYNTVHLYSLLNPSGKPTSLLLKLPDFRGNVYPFKVIFDADRVYVFASMEKTIQMVRGIQGLFAVEKIAVLAFDPVTGKQLWNRRPASEGDTPALQDIAETKQHLVVNLWRTNDTGGVCLLIDKSTGEVVQRLTLPVARRSARIAFRPRRAIAVGGRLAVETGDGITVYGH